MSYSRKLRDARWQRLRLKVMERDGWRCQAEDCRSPENSMLHVHHKQYLPQRDPWDYPLENLITYCEKCHERAHVAANPTVLVEGSFYPWRELPGLLRFKPVGFLTENSTRRIICGCFRLDTNPDAPDIVLPGTTDQNWARKARAYFNQRSAIPVFVKGEDFGWEYCGKYRAEALTTNEAEIAIHAERAEARNEAIAMVLFLEKE